MAGRSRIRRRRRPAARADALYIGSVAAVAGMLVWRLLSPQAPVASTT